MAALDADIVVGVAVAFAQNVDPALLLTNAPILMGVRVVEFGLE